MKISLKKIALAIAIYLAVGIVVIVLLGAWATTNFAPEQRNWAVSYWIDNAKNDLGGTALTLVAWPIVAVYTADGMINGFPN